MNKLAIRNFSKNLLLNFVTAIFVMGVIVWTIQAVNFFDFVTKDGHGIKVYFIYSFLAFPKIVHRIIPFIFFISLFFTIIKYENKNELNIFWSFGVTKVYFSNIIIFFSLILMVFQIFLGTFLSPKFQFEGRNYLKNSNVDFFTSLIDEGKFVNIAKDLTIIVKKKNKDDTYSDIFIEDLTKNNPRMISAKKGVIFDDGKKKNFVLSGGKILNLEGSKINSFEFEQINFDLSNYSSKTIITPKIQEIKTSELLKCIKTSKNYSSELFDCKMSLKNEIRQELIKRIYKPIFLPIIAIFCCFIFTRSKYDIRFNINNRLIFLSSFLLLLFSEVFLRYSSGSIIIFYFFLTIPIVIFVYSYFHLCKRVRSV